jgi:hypothetical protein
LANNRIQVKRTNVSGRTPNTTNSSNSQYIQAGEFALNMPDGILYTSNGSSLIAVGSNNSNVNVTNKLTANSITAGSIKHSPVVISKILNAFDAADSDEFHSVALSGDGAILAVGATNWEGTTGTNRGGVYIYEWNGTVWVQRGDIIQPSDAGNDDLFGKSVALNTNGTILAVGASQWDEPSGTNNGAVYLFTWDGTNWIERPAGVVTLASVGEVISDNDDAFGTSVAITNDVLVVGAPGQEDPGQSNRGAVYVFYIGNFNSVYLMQTLFASDAADGDSFGTSVAIGPTTLKIVVGAPGWEGTSTPSGVGSVYIFDYDNNITLVWNEIQILTSGDGATNDVFGSSVAIDGQDKTIAVGAPSWETTSGISNWGGVYIFDNNTDIPLLGQVQNWVQRGSVLQAADYQFGDNFGNSIALSSDASTLLVGARAWEGTTGSNRGAVYTYSMSSKTALSSIPSTGSGWIEGANSSLVSRTAGLDRITVYANGNVSVANTITLKSINAAGSIGSAGQVLTVDANGEIIWEDIQPTNSLYVAKNGNDTTGDGSVTRPYLTIKKALSVSTAGTTIKISSGIYTEDNPLTVPADVSIIGESLRNVTVIPQTTNLDVFWLNNGSYVTELTLKNYVSPAAAFAFPDSGAGNITRSPYVLNCTSLTTTGIGLHIDGSKATGNRSMIAGLYTIINQGGIGVKITNKGYSQLVNIYTICTDISILAEQGGFCTLNCSDTSFGNYGLVANGTSASLYSGVTFGDDQFGSQIVIKGLSQTPYINNVLKLTGDDTYYTVVGVTPMVSNTSTVTIQERIAIPVANNTTANFYQRSYIAAAGHAFEYVGTGTNLATASPFAGGIVNSNNQSISVNGGVVNYTSTDQFGNFNINNNLTINGINATIEGDAFQRSLFGLMTPYILAIEGAQ